jgi:hypothetical protein
MRLCPFAASARFPRCLPQGFHCLHRFHRRHHLSLVRLPLIPHFRLMRPLMQHHPKPLRFLQMFRHLLNHHPPLTRHLLLFRHPPAPRR